MAVLSRILAAAALVSFTFADIAGASAAEHYGVAAQRARAHANNNHHERAAHIKAAGGENRKRDVQKRCKAATTSLSSHHASTTSPATTAHHSTTTKHTTSTKTTTKDDAPTEAVTKKKLFSSSAKKALAWSGTNKELAKFVNNEVVAVYNWGATPPSGDGLISLCMLWGERNLADFRKNRDNYDVLMGMNEMNLGSQSGLTYTAAAKLWNAEVRPYGLKGKTLIAPSVTTATTGLTFLENFFKACKEEVDDGLEWCGADMTSAHVYDTSSAKVISYLQSLHDAIPLPIYMSEFACMTFYDEAPCSNPETFMQEIMDFCKSTSWMALCSPYGFSPDYSSDVALINSSGEPTALGYAFLNA